MTNPDRRLYVGVIDKSGSMIRYMEETLTGWNSLVKEQAKIGGAFASLFTFSTMVRPQYQFVEADEVPELHVHANGWTALYDAIGTAIESTGAILAKMPEHERPGGVYVVIYTDSLDNYSNRHTQAEIRRMVEHQRSVYNWTFLFHGAEQDAVLTGSELGVPVENSMSYSTVNTGATLHATSEMLSRGALSGVYAYTDRERAEASKA